MADPLWTSAEIARATGGVERGGFSATGVSIDTRSLEAGDLFVALAGARDGHTFLEAARARATRGEISLALEKAWGRHTASSALMAGAPARGRARRLCRFMYDR